MKFGIYAELQNPEQNKKPHAQVYQEILEQIEQADKRELVNIVVSKQ